MPKGQTRKANLKLRAHVEVELGFNDEGYFYIMEKLAKSNRPKIYMSAKKAQALAEWIIKHNKKNSRSVDPIERGYFARPTK